MSSNTKARKQAVSFVRSLSDSLLQDTGLYYEAGLKEGFSECIAALPEGNLKQELVDNMEQYCVDLLSAMRKEGRLRAGGKGHTKKRRRKPKSGLSASEGQLPSDKLNDLEGGGEMNALTDVNVEESLKKVKDISNFEDRFEKYCLLARASSTCETQLQSVLQQWQEELCVCDEEGGRFPQLLSAIEFCLLATAGFGVNVEESYTLVWLQFCARIFHHLVHIPRGLSLDELEQLAEKITNTLTIAKLRTPEHAATPLREQLAAILSSYIEVAVLQSKVTLAHTTAVMHSLLGSSPAHYLDALITIPLPPSHETAKRSFLYSVFRYALSCVHRTHSCRQYAKFVVACSMCMALMGKGQSGKDVKEIAMAMPVPDGFVKTVCSTSPCLAERAGIQLGTKSREVTSLLLWALDDNSSRADILEVFSAEMKGEVFSTKQQQFEEETEDEDEGGAEEEESGEDMEEEEEVYGTVLLSVDDSCIDESEVDIKEDDSDLGQTGAEGEFVWKKTGSSLEEDEVEASVDTRHEEDFLSLTTTSDSALESGSKQLSKQKWRKKRANNEGELSSLDELTDGSLDCGHRDKGSTSTQGRCTGTRKRMSLRQRCLPPLLN